MGTPWELELLDHRPKLTTVKKRNPAPGDAVLPEELDVLWEIARRADPVTGECFGQPETFARLLGISDKKHNDRGFKRLEALGFDIRVPIGKKKNGEPLYANSSRAATFRFPRLCPDPGPDGFHDRARCFPGERAVVTDAAVVVPAPAPIDADELVPATYIEEIRQVRARVQRDSLRLWSPARVRAGLAAAVAAGARPDDAQEAMRDMAERAYVRAPGFLAGSNDGLDADWWVIARERRTTAERQEAERARRLEIEDRAKLPRPVEEPAVVEPHDPLCDGGSIALPGGETAPCRQCKPWKFAQWAEALKQQYPEWDAWTVDEYRRRADAGELGTTGRTVVPFRQGRAKRPA